MANKQIADDMFETFQQGQGPGLGFEGVGAWGAGAKGLGV